MKNLILVGAPGSGKGTQADLLVEQSGATHVSTGGLFREQIRSKSELGILADSFISKGQLVPDEVTCAMLKKHLATLDLSSGIILDGFPRTLSQAESLNTLFSEINLTLTAAVYIEVPEQELVSRLSSRRICPKCGATYSLTAQPGLTRCLHDDSVLEHRSDDMPAAVRVRLKAYQTQTHPLLEYYEKRKKLLKIDGLGAVERVFREILNKLQE